MDKIEYEQYKDLRIPKTLRVLGAVALCAGLIGGCSSNVDAHHITAPILEVPQATATPDYSASPAPTESKPSAIEPNIAASTIRSVNLFGDGQIAVSPYQVKVNNGAADLTPPERDGVFYATLAYSDPDTHRVYHFGGELATDKSGNIIGDVLVQGHTNSGGNWVMNGAMDYKVGDTITLTSGDAVYTAEITKITPIKKTGPNNAWPGFGKSLGPNGAIETCKLSVDSNGNTIQSGYITVYAIKIIAVKKLS